MYKNKTFAIIKDNNQKKSSLLTSIIIYKINKNKYNNDYTQQILNIK